MKLSEAVALNKKTLTFQGFVDLGEFTTSKLANVRVELHHWMAFEKLWTESAIGGRIKLNPEAGEPIFRSCTTVMSQTHPPMMPNDSSKGSQHKYKEGGQIGSICY